MDIDGILMQSNMWCETHHKRRSAQFMLLEDSSYSAKSVHENPELCHRIIRIARKPHPILPEHTTDVGYFSSLGSPERKSFYSRLSLRESSVNTCGTMRLATFAERKATLIIHRHLLPVDATVLFPASHAGRVRVPDRHHPPVVQ